MTKVTQRWKHLFNKLPYFTMDMVEIDNIYYFCVFDWMTNDKIVEKWDKKEQSIYYTFEELRESKGSHPHLKSMYEAVRLSKAKCTCGSDKIGGPGHDWWCDKFQGEK